MNANELADCIEFDAPIMGIKKEVAAMLRNQQNEIELLETEIFVKGAVLKSYKEALEQIATGELTNESNNYKDTVYVMRNIALDALAILKKASEK